MGEILKNYGSIIFGVIGIIVAVIIISVVATTVKNSSETQVNGLNTYANEAISDFQSEEVTTAP